MDFGKETREKLARLLHKESVETTNTGDSGHLKLQGNKSNLDSVMTEFQAALDKKPNLTMLEFLAQKRKV